ncbi:hypothetical protein [uncultured Cohaesibacter sp.]|uniref:hypothetical protein n=1 Tax=uncultured Cohaesibacter sp. TaxID=1002546 RepID=UPI0029C923F8|nr:hypothetical protein [uncultured Cohaesibacter sp.]
MSDDWETVILGPKWAVRVRDFGLDDWLKLNCPCGHVAIVSTEKMKATQPGYMRLKTFEHKFRCRKCGNNEGIFWSVVRRKDAS